MTNEKKDKYQIEFYTLYAKPGTTPQQLFQWVIDKIEKLEEDRRIAYDIIAHLGTIIGTKP